MSAESVEQSGPTTLLGRALVALAILLIGGGAVAIMLMTRDVPEKVEHPYLGPLVESVAAPPITVRITVKGQGTVQPGAEIDLVSQVAGIVVWKSAQLEAGGYFSAGELLVRIDARDYELAVEAAAAEVAQAEYGLEVERGEAAVASQEWERMRPEAEGDTAATASPLVLHIPQMRAAEARLAASRARLGEANLRLARTRLHAPFSGRVRDSTVDRGQFANIGQPLAHLYSVETAEITVAVPDEDLVWLDLPGPPQAAAGGGDDMGEVGIPAQSPGQSAGTPIGELVSGEREAEWRSEAVDAAGTTEVLVTASVGGRELSRKARLVRSEAQLDPRTRMARLVVQVDEPYADESAPLMVGAFVEVAIGGAMVEGVRSIPRLALRSGNTVWTGGPEGVLRIRPARVVRAAGEQILVYVDMAPGERVITSQLSGVTDGMKVRLSAALPAGEGDR